MAETPEALLDEDTTPTARHFLRHNGRPPPPLDAGAWTLTIDGEVERPLRLTLADLRARFPTRAFPLVMECGGNGRAFHSPSPRGNPWTNGGIGCALWEGVSLADVLRAAGPTPRARFTGHGSVDEALEDPALQPMSRGLPLWKALEPHTLLAWAMNGAPLAPEHGAPLRLIAPGFPGSVSTKWLARIELRAARAEGPGMAPHLYRLPPRPLAPGEAADFATFHDMESMPTRSIVTRPADGARLPAGTRELVVRGAAWAGEREVVALDLTLNGGRTWTAAPLAPPRNRYDWRRFEARLPLPSDGHFEVAARATDSHGEAQPALATGWNPEGYGANPWHRVGVRVG